MGAFKSVGSLVRRVALWSLCAGFVCAALGASAETYYLAGSDKAGKSAMNGTGSVGWRDSSGKTTQAHCPSGGNVYVVDGQGATLSMRTPTVTGFTFGGDSLTLKDGAEIKVKIPNDGIITIPSLIVDGNARLAQADGNTTKTVDGAITVNKGACLGVDVSYDDGTTARRFDIKSSISGSGEIWSGVRDDKTSKTPFVKFSGSMAAFTGKLTFQSGLNVASEVYFYDALPGDPVGVTAEGFTLVGKPVVKFMSSGKLGYTRGVALDAEVCEIYVDAGQTVQIDGLVTGAAGFKKTGAGTLALASPSPELAGVITVAAGTLQLCDVKEKALPNAEVSVSSGATLDEHGPRCSRAEVLQVTGFPETYGEASPAYGETNGLVVGESFLCSAVASVTNAAGNVAYDCIGYKVYTNDVVCVEGEGNSFTYEHPNCENGAKLVWQWVCKYKVIASASAGGSISPAEQWVRAGSIASFTVTPDAGHFVFYKLTDGVTESREPRFLVTQPLELTAIFTTFQTLEPAEGDASARIQAAIDSSLPDGIVQLTAGEYALEAGLVMTNSVRLRGAGLGQTVLTGPEEGAFAACTLSDEGAELSDLTISNFKPGAVVTKGSIVDCKFINCALDGVRAYGGGVNLVDGLVCGCLFKDCNVSGTYSKGGGLYMTGGVVSNCTFRGCHTKNSNAAGGGAWVYGGLFANNRILSSGGDGKRDGSGLGVQKGTVRNTLVADSVGDTRGQVQAVKIENGLVENCTFANNMQGMADCEAVLLTGGTLRNSIIWGNGGTNDLVITGGTVEYCCYPGATEGENGNTANDPQLKKGCCIKSCSPCRNAGLNQGWMTGATDLDGNPRILNEVVDMGCYEVSPSGLVIFVQ